MTNNTKLTPWQRVMICRDPKRPRSVGYLAGVCEEFTEIFGDRLYRDDPAIIGGFASIGGKKFVVIAQEKGFDTESRLKRNFGMPHPEGYRKALRLMKLAEKFSLPILCLIDTPGAYPGLSAEERGQGSAIATNLLEMAALKVPIIALLIGEGCSGGALGIGVADVIGMLEHSYYSVISPEGCASILWKDTKMNARASEMLKIHAEELIKAGIVDEIIEEPEGGAHNDHELTYSRAKSFILEQHELLSKYNVSDLLEVRYQKFRRMGHLHSLPLREEVNI
ncbi:MAG: acetyl-CoA carboxylase carboxyltransferase subunit alpha [Chlamydiae bacterium]|nr:acetyl-CoA carboxylase carboxyltransferase subunit alpha [Chlamydiota bacterium]